MLKLGWLISIKKTQHNTFVYGKKYFFCTLDFKILPTNSLFFFAICIFVCSQNRLKHNLLDCSTVHFQIHLVRYTHFLRKCQNIFFIEKKFRSNFSIVHVWSNLYCVHTHCGGCNISLVDIGLMCVIGKHLWNCFSSAQPAWKFVIYLFLV